MPNRFARQQEVRRYLQRNLSAHDWIFSLPGGRGMETYYVQANEYEYFVKVGAPVERYLAMGEIGLTPPILSLGQLQDGTSIFVQPHIKGRTPSRRDFQNQLSRVAAILHKMHDSAQIRSVLPGASSHTHKELGRQALDHLLQRWERYKSAVPGETPFVDKSLEELAKQIDRFSSEGVVASHNDICNANWLFAADGEIYIVDLDAMSLDDPAQDLGALLWWYYPPEVRRQFLEMAGHSYDEEFKFRMRVRMALHCLSILLPRERGYERFHSKRFHDALVDFKAVFEGKENPQGYAS